ncbi:hypothetical protein BJY04DRAFT_182339 [Aspergillus karnatakaensis]|uniref:F-box protein n=1 Tax=Aspergillus karnatakaensis TaxID=1810916 RepID=UPI003CCD8736
MPGRSGSAYGQRLCKSSTTDWMQCLPPEIALQILSYLSFEDLLAFGATSRLNNEYHIVSLKRLRLGVFEKRVHSIISLLQAGWATPDQPSSAWGENMGERNYTVSVVQQQYKSKKQGQAREQSTSTTDSKKRTPRPRERPQSQEQMVRLQNQVLTRLLRRYGPSLRNLEFMAYDLNLEGATALGTRCQHTLLHLALRFEHPHIRDGLMRPSTWLHPAPGNEAWNLLIGLGRHKDTGLRSLDTLILERAGITSWQLMMLVKKNPDLRTLKLRTCRGARPEFLYWLGGIKNDFEEEYAIQLRESAPGAKLETFWLEHCHRLLEHPVEENDSLTSETYDCGFEWVRGLKKLRSLSFSESAHISSEFLDRANKTIWKIPELILPYFLNETSSVIAVDPKWK